VDEAHRVFDSDQLRPGRLDVPLCPTEAGKQQRLPTGHEVPAIQLGGDVGGQGAVAERARDPLGVGGRGEEVAAHPEEHAGAPRFHRLDRADHVQSGSPGRSEAKPPFQRVEERRRRPVIDPHRPIALHVAVAAHGTDPGAGTPERAPEQQQVDDLLNVRDGVLVLGEPHRPAGDDPLRSGQHLRQLPHRSVGDPARRDQVIGRLAL
jgi:hypothetical protein